MGEGVQRQHLEALLLPARSLPTNMRSCDRHCVLFKLGFGHQRHHGLQENSSQTVVRANESSIRAHL